MVGLQRKEREIKVVGRITNYPDSQKFGKRNNDQSSRFPFSGQTRKKKGMRTQVTASFRPPPFMARELFFSTPAGVLKTIWPKKEKRPSNVMFLFSCKRVFILHHFPRNPYFSERIKKEEKLSSMSLGKRREWKEAYENSLTASPPPPLPMLPPPSPEAVSECNCTTTSFAWHTRWST